MRDGEVTGCRFGIIAGTDTRVTDVVDGVGRAVTSKIEGIEARRDDNHGFDVVTDSDRPGEPAQLGYLRVTDASLTAPNAETLA